MTRERASIFAGDDTLDVSAFAPKAAHELNALLTELGGVSPDAILGIEVVWTPADPNDSMTETDVMTTYPKLRSL